MNQPTRTNGFNPRYAPQPPATARSMHPDIGRVGFYHSPNGALHFRVKVLDVRQGFRGKWQWLVTPVTGEGTQWTEAVTIIADGPGAGKAA